MRTIDRVAALAAGRRCLDCGRSGPLLCESCARLAPIPSEQPPPSSVDRILARWRYEGVPRSLILDLKLRGVRSAAVPLGRGVSDLVVRRGLRSAVLTWVPGRDADNRNRGFDHAELIAGVIAERLGLRCRPLLWRRGLTLDQTGLTLSERRANLSGAFAARAISGWVAVVDDVVTSGATAQACGRALREAGADGVEVLSACRA